MVVYYLHRKTSLSTICTNGKQKFSIKKKSLQEWRVPFTQPLNYREGLKEAQPVQNGRFEMMILNEVAHV